MLNYDRLFRYGLHGGHDRASVMEGINEVFTDIWTGRDHLPEVAHVAGYLFIIFKRKLFRIRAQRGEALLVAEEAFEAIEPSEASYEDLLIAYQASEARQAALRVALDRLTPRQKELIRLRYYDSLSVEEISEKVHIAARTIYNTLHAAIRILRAQLHNGE